MIIVGKPYKFGRWQITRVIDNFGVKKIEVKYFNKNRNGGLNFNKYKALYVLPKDWREFLQKAKGKKKHEP